MERVILHDKEFELFIPSAKVHGAIDRLAIELQSEYAGRRPLFLGVLNGSFVFAAELVKRLSMECEISFIKVASYLGTASSGNISQLIGLNEKLEGRHVVILEDIVDTGNTLEHVMKALEDHHPASVEVAALLFKPNAYKKEIPVRYVALEVPNDFVVGCGLDHDGLGRNLSGIFRLVGSKKKAPTPSATKT